MSEKAKTTKSTNIMKWLVIVALIVTVGVGVIAGISGTSNSSSGSLESQQNISTETEENPFQ